MHRSERSSIVHHRHYQDEYGANEQASAVSTDRIGFNDQVTRAEADLHNESNAYFLAIALVESGKLSNIAGQVLQTLVDAHPHIASEEEFAHIWPDVSENPNLLWQHVKRLRKLDGAIIYRYRKLGYSLNREPLFHDKPSWAAYFTTQENKLLAAIEYKSGSLSYDSICDLLQLRPQNETKSNFKFLDEYLLNSIRLVMSRIRTKFSNLHLGTIDTVRGKSLYQFIIVAEHSQEAIPENR